MCRSRAAGGRRCPCTDAETAHASWRDRTNRRRARRRAADRWQADVARQAETSGTVATLDDAHLRTLSLDEASELLSEYTHDAAAAERICAYLDEREAEDRDWARWKHQRDQEGAYRAAQAEGEWQQWCAEQEADGLGAPALRPTIRAGRRLTATQQAREDYEAYVVERYVQAETDCRGHLLNRAGRAADVDPYSLFSGRYARVRRYGSEELREWFGRHGRLTWTEFRWQALHRESDRGHAYTAGRGGVDEWSA